MFSEILSFLPTQLADFTPFAQNGRIDRAALSEETATQLIKRGEEALNQPYPAIPATAYMDFCRTGNRVRFEALYMARRRTLNALALAEFVERKGRFLDGVIDGIYALCEESGWQLPAHNSYVRDTPQRILPDTEAPVLDLFACETGAQLAMVRYLLREELDEVSPLICKRILSELNTRIVTPYLNRHFWWMGNGDEPMCNWTPWCTQNVLITVFTTDQPQDIKQHTVRQAAYSLDCFLKDYGEDGCCEEGAQYYRHAGLCLLNATEVLNAVCGNVFAPLYREPKIRNLAAYILSMHVDDKYYINFADCSPIAGRAGVREFLFGLRTENPNLTAFAAEEWQKSEGRDLPDEINLFYRLQAAFLANEISAYHPEKPVRHPELYYPSVGIFIARDSAYCLAVKAGDNNDSHNHNDTGSFTVYKNGLPFLIDVGVESYTKKTFSPRRYEIWTMQSAYHNLPTFGGVMQKDGAAFAARDVEVSFKENQSSISMDISGAYPPEAGVEHYLRRVTLHKGAGITVEDRFSGSRSEAVLSLMFCEKPGITGRTIAVGSLGTVSADRGELRVESIPINDPRLRLAWPETLWRVLIRFEGQLTLNLQ